MVHLPESRLVALWTDMLMQLPFRKPLDSPIRGFAVSDNALACLGDNLREEIRPAQGVKLSLCLSLPIARVNAHKIAKIITYVASIAPKQRRVPIVSCWKFSSDVMR